LSRDVFNQLMRGERTDSVPFWEVWFAKFQMQRSRYGDPSQVESSIRMAGDLGMAAVGLRFVDLNCSFSDYRRLRDGSFRYGGGSLTSLSQLEQREVPDWSELIPELRDRREQLRKADLAGVLYLPWCFHTIATSMGLEDFSYKLYDDRGFLKTCMRWVQERARNAIRAIAPAVEPDLVLFDGDCAYKNGLMIKPADLRDLVYDETEATVSLLREMDIPYAFHTDGKLDDVIPMLIELGFSAIHGCEKTANDLDHLVDEFGDDICLIGNMDIGFLASASIPEIHKEARDMIRRGKRKGRFIAACNTSPTDDIPDENYLAFCEAIRDCRADS
jgi:uroporphyrinogen decarboxylase